MTDPHLSSGVPVASGPDLLPRLRAHRTLSQVPDAELEWLISHGTLLRYEQGEYMTRRGEPVGGIYFMLRGRLSHFVERGGVWRKVIDWRDGDATGKLPYSRMTVSPGNAMFDEPSELFVLSPADAEVLPVECPRVTAALVHEMLDRARVFKSSDLQIEKMASLGKLAAGLAHELNNPASAATRGAQLLVAALTESEEASRALGAAQLSDAEQAGVNRVRERCGATATAGVLSPLERSDREESIGDWLASHDADDSFAASLAETDVELAALEKLAGVLSGEKLSAALRWLAAGCNVRLLARDVERASSRVHALVSAVKSFTFMDQATVPEPVDVRKGLDDTGAILGAKARGKSASLTIEVAADVPRVLAFGGELNQVWVNLIDNALDAVDEGGSVAISARAAGKSVIVRVTDNGPGIPAELKSRIFEPFFTTKPVGKGTGLGLDIVRSLVEHNNGLIDLDSAPGHTEFRVTLPVADAG